MATKKIRIYELARELGVENEVVLDLANELKIGVKSHSSSIEDPMADRVRRLADTKGLRQAPAEEPEPAPAKGLNREEDGPQHARARAGRACARRAATGGTRTSRGALHRRDPRARPVAAAASSCAVAHGALDRRDPRAARSHERTRVSRAGRVRSSGSGRRARARSAGSRRSS